MKITSLTKSWIIKMQTYDFHSTDIYFSLTANLDEGDDPTESGRLLSKELHKQVEETKEFLDSLDPAIFKLPKKLGPS